MVYSRIAACHVPYEPTCEVMNYTVVRALDLQRVGIARLPLTRVLYR